MDTVIKFENISKQYRLGLISTQTISHDLNRWYQVNIRRKEDPYLKIGDVNDRSTKAQSEYVWALKNINFEVQQGDVLGIIGKNGAGKSTLLKILSKVTAPTTGKIKAKGRIASLLEVGTGFHPEMTGRENIYMNGAIMGMSKSEIKRKLDEIVEFSGVERYIDTPTKRYSSGMTVRLGFAIAAHLEPEILVVDEVLAVGDAEFQKKAIGKMKNVSQGEGRTVLFVSHNMVAVQALCTKGIILQNGYCVKQGGISECVSDYLQLNQRTDRKIIDSVEYNSSKLIIKSIVVNSQDGNNIYVTPNDNVLNIEISGYANLDLEMDFEFRLSDLNERKLAIYSPGHNGFTIKKYRKGPFNIVQQVTLPSNMNSGTFVVSLFLSRPNEEFLMSAIKCLYLESEGKLNLGMVINYDNEGWLSL